MKEAIARGISLGILLTMGFIIIAFWLKSRNGLLYFTNGMAGAIINYLVWELAKKWQIGSRIWPKYHLPDIEKGHNRDE